MYRAGTSPARLNPFAQKCNNKANSLSYRAKSMLQIWRMSRSFSYVGSPVFQCENRMVYIGKRALLRYSC